jgi:hypothetical protein
MRMTFSAALGDLSRYERHHTKHEGEIAHGLSELLPVTLSIFCPKVAPDCLVVPNGFPHTWRNIGAPAWFSSTSQLILGVFGWEPVVRIREPG